MSYPLFFLLTFSLAFVLTAVGTRILLPILRRRHVGQRILEIGPAWHKAKEGTPTMGGLGFIAATCLSLFVAGGLYAERLPALFWRPLLLTLLFALANATVGIADDMTKLRRKQNEGLTPSQKLILQITFAVAYLLLMRLYGHIDTGLYIPYFNTVWELGGIYYFFCVLLSVGMINCVNLSDGVDGLCSVTSLALGAFFAVAATRLGEVPAFLTATAMIGAALGFLIFNRHPARIFMGDTGSLFLGSLGVGCAFLLGNPLILLVAGGVFAFEGASVILQVIYYKLTKRRLFRMAPFHHHLERCGWRENRIVLLFLLASLLLSVIALPGVGW